MDVRHFHEGHRARHFLVVLVDDEQRTVAAVVSNLVPSPVRRLAAEERLLLQVDAFVLDYAPSCGGGRTPRSPHSGAHFSVLALPLLVLAALVLGAEHMGMA